MHVICNVIVGAPIPKNSNYRLVDDIDIEEIPWDELGFKTLYSGNANGPVGYCGIELAKFNECNNQLVSRINLTPTAEQINQATQLLAGAKQNLRNYLEDCEFEEPEILKCINYFPDKPDVYFVWSTS